MGDYEFGEIVSPIKTKITWPNQQFSDFSNENSGAHAYQLPYNDNVLP
jgi:hypothetical protein